MDDPVQFRHDGRVIHRGAFLKGRGALVHGRYERGLRGDIVRQVRIDF